MQQTGYVTIWMEFEPQTQHVCNNFVWSSFSEAFAVNF